MACDYRFLSGTPFTDVHRTFNDAFADYAVKAGEVPESVLYNRAVKNGIVLDCSVGAFDGGRMVGFTMIGIDRWKGEPAAFDIGTGIIKPFRGQGVARGMFEHALPRLRDRGLKRFVLEVLRQNKPALKAYARTGFTITREFECFQLALEGTEGGEEAAVPLEIAASDRNCLIRFAEHLDWEPSWENSIASIERIPDEVLLLTARLDGVEAGLLVYYPGLKWILSLVVARSHRRKGVGTALVRNLVARLAGCERTVKLINVLSTDTGMIAFLRGIGFEDYVGQYEMELALA